MLLAAAGLLGVILTVVAANLNPGWSRAWAGLALASFMVLTLCGAYVAALVPDREVVAYRSMSTSRPEGTSIPEFLPDEAARMHVRRVTVHVALVLSLILWVLCWGIPIAVMVPTLGNVDAEIDPTGGFISMAVGGITLIAYCVIQSMLPQLTTQNAHLRSLRAALAHATVQPNRTSGSMMWMVRNSTPGTRARRMGASYLAISGGKLSVWCHGSGRLTKAIEIPLASITNVNYSWVSLGIAGVPGIALDTTALTRPLELCPLDHVMDWAASARRLGQRLAPELNEAVSTVEDEPA
jgi:hypothetical protein